MHFRLCAWMDDENAAAFFGMCEEFYQLKSHRAVKQALLSRRIVYPLKVHPPVPVSSYVTLTVPRRLVEFSPRNIFYNLILGPKLKKGVKRIEIRILDNPDDEDFRFGVHCLLPDNIGSCAYFGNSTESTIIFGRSREPALPSTYAIRKGAVLCAELDMRLHTLRFFHNNTPLPLVVCNIPAEVHFGFCGKGSRFEVLSFVQLPHATPFRSFSVAVLKNGSGSSSGSSSSSSNNSRNSVSTTTTTHSPSKKGSGNSGDKSSSSNSNSGGINAGGVGAVVGGAVEYVEWREANREGTVAAAADAAGLGLMTMLGGDVEEGLLVENGEDGDDDDDEEVDYAWR